MSLKLYEIPEAYRNLLELLETDPENDDFKTALENIENNTVARLSSLASVIDETESEMTIIKDKISDLKAKLDTRKNAVEKIKKYILTFMQETGQSKISNGILTVSIRKNPAKVDVINEEAIPEKYLSTKIVLTVDKRKILDDWKNNGIEIEGTRIIQDERVCIK